MLRSVAFLLAQVASAATDETCNLVYDFIEAMGAQGDASTIINVLTAVHRQAMNELAWRPVERARW